jgi:Fe-S-cluster containining protein
MEFIPDPELEKKNNESPFFICTQCGECCHIREKKNFSQEEEHAYYRFMFNKFGIIYLASLNHITINVWPEEKDILVSEAKKKNIELRIKPKRALYNLKNQELIILDYYIDHDTCPFFDKKNKLCQIYNERPLICRSYPLLTTRSYGKCKYKNLDYNAYKDEKSWAEQLEIRMRKQTNIINEMLKNGDIAIADVTEEIIAEAFMKNKIIELRIE